VKKHDNRGRPDGTAAFWVVASTDGPMAQTKEHICWPSKVGVPAPGGCFLNKERLVPTTRSPLSSSNWRWSELPTAMTSPVMTSRDHRFRLQGPEHIQEAANRSCRGENEWVDKILDLMDAVDASIPRARA